MPRVYVRASTVCCFSLAVVVKYPSLSQAADSVGAALRTPLSGACLLKEVCRKPLFGVCVGASCAEMESAP